MTSPKSQAAGTPIEAVAPIGEIRYAKRGSIGFNGLYPFWYADKVPPKGTLLYTAADLATVAHEAREAMREEAAVVAFDYGAPRGLVDRIRNLPLGQL